jgi:heme oxygenase
MSLKDLTWEHHQNAERQAFAKEMLKGEVTNERYAQYLYNQFKMYDVLETIAMANNCFNDLGRDFRRAPKIKDDFLELWEDGFDNPPEELPVTEEYIKHILSIQNNKRKVMAHVYVRHMGDLSGGQMLAKKVPGSGKLYDFTNDAGLTIEQLKEIIRERCDDSMADEAKVAFDFATKLFEQMG